MEEEEENPRSAFAFVPFFLEFAAAAAAWEIMQEVGGEGESEGKTIGEFGGGGGKKKSKDKHIGPIERGRKPINPILTIGITSPARGLNSGLGELRIVHTHTLFSWNLESLF